MTTAWEELTQFQLFIFRLCRRRTQLIEDMIVTLIISLKHDPEQRTHFTLNTLRSSSAWNMTLSTGHTSHSTHCVHHRPETRPWALNTLHTQHIAFIIGLKHDPEHRTPEHRTHFTLNTLRSSSAWNTTLSTGHTSHSRHCNQILQQQLESVKSC